MEFSTNGFMKEHTANGQSYVSLPVESRDRNAVREFLLSVKPGEAYAVTVKKKTGKRSLDANAYFWALCGKLAAKLRTTREEIYREYVREIDGASVTLPIREDAREAFMRNWGGKGIGWICEDMGPSKAERFKGFRVVICHYGSSTFDKAQMAQLIDLAVQDCKAQGIETMAPDEIARMNSLWDAKKGMGKQWQGVG
jgi:hypothetical protein